MTRNKDLKKLVRARAEKTGESYSAALAHFREQPERQEAGKTAETAALARALSGRFSEELILGVGGGIGAAYFTFEYKLPPQAPFRRLVNVYVGGRINPFVQKRDFVEAAAARLSALAASKTATSPKVAEKQLREVLALGQAAIVTVEAGLLPHSGMPREWAVGDPRPVLVSLEDGEPRVTDRAGRPFALDWKTLGAARARNRSEKNRLLAIAAPAQIDVARAVREGIAATIAGMTKPPMKSFGLGALAKWAEMVTHPRDKKGWPKMFAGGRDLLQAMSRLYHWIETAGTGGGNSRAMYAGFLDEAAEVLGKPTLSAVAARYRALAAAWSDVARAVLPDDVPAMREARELLERRARLLGSADAATIEGQLAALYAAHQDQAPPGLSDLPAFFAGVARRVEAVREGEAAALEALRAV